MKTLAERFWAKVARSDGCWLWTACTNRKGYGFMFVAKHPTRIVKLAHRVSWELHNGKITSGLNVLHRCDVPACVNPRHLFLGTLAENNQDMKLKGRSTIGERNPMAKLTERDVLSIIKDQSVHRIIANKFGVSTSTVSYVKSRKVWGHVSAA